MLSTVKTEISIRFPKLLCPFDRPAQRAKFLTVWRSESGELKNAPADCFSRREEVLQERAFSCYEKYIFSFDS